MDTSVASAARDSHRQPDGRFGLQPRREPAGLRLVPDTADAVSPEAANQAINRAWHREWAARNTVRMTVEATADTLREAQNDSHFDQDARNLAYALYVGVPAGKHPEMDPADAGRLLLAEAGTQFQSGSHAQRIHSRLTQDQPDLLAGIISAVRTRREAQAASDLAG